MRRLAMFLTLATLIIALAACEQDSPSSPMESGLADDTSDAELSFEQSARSHGTTDHGIATYEITLENLTPNTGDGGSQVFSPPVIATHRRGISMFRRGHFASPGLAAIAQDAINGPMVERFAASDLVHEVSEGDGVIFPGDSETYRVEGMPRRGRLSMAFMLVNTNDGFSGVNSLRLPRTGERSFYVVAYDAGSELNTELVSDIPGPCCGNPQMGTPTHQRIRAHRGIRGHADLARDKWGWHGRVAKITVKRIH